MENNTQKSSNNIRQSLHNIPDDLFLDPNLDIKIRLVKNEYIRDPLRIAVLIKKMVDQNKRIG